MIWLEELVTRALDPLIEAIWPSIVLWRWWALIATVLLVAVIWYRKEVDAGIENVKEFFGRESEREDVSPDQRATKGKRGHDRDIFLRSTKVMDEELLMEAVKKLRGTTRIAGPNHWIDMDELNAIRDFIEFHERVENEYSYRSLNVSTDRLIRSLKELRDLIETEFEIGEGNRWVLKEIFKNGGKGIDAATIDLEETLDRTLERKVNQAVKNLRSYRKAVKDQLMM